MTTIATAHVVFDRDYFTLQYDDWLRHRARFRQYEAKLASMMVGTGITLLCVAPRHWLGGAILAWFGAFEFVMAVTHRRRWIRARLRSVPADKSVDFTFDEESITTSSPNGTATMANTMFSGFASGTDGFFLIPEGGVSIYVPRDSIHPPEAYPALEELFQTAMRAEPTIAPSPPRGMIGQ